MLSLQTFQLGDLTTNTYLIADPTAGTALIVDPADDANFICEQLIYQHLTPLAIIATHGHFDHLLAGWELEMAFGIPTIIHQKDLPFLKHLARSASWWLKKKIIEKPPQNIIELTTVNPQDQKLIDYFPHVPSSMFDVRILPTPGHTPGSICIYFPAQKWLITGDTLFADGSLGRTDLPYSSITDQKHSISTLSHLPGDLTIYPGHGDPGLLSNMLNMIAR